MTDYLLDSHSSNDASQEECIAWNEDDLWTCPCQSCQAYRQNKMADAIYQEKLDAENIRNDHLCDDPYYQSPGYLNSVIHKSISSEKVKNAI